MADSEEYSTDECTKKRRAQRQMDVGFERSKKTARTPTKEKERSDEKLDLLINMVRDIKCEMENINDKVEKMKTEQKEFKEEFIALKRENENLRKENKKIREENKEIKQELKGVKNNLEEYEKERRKNNVIIYGLKTDKSDKDKMKEALDKFIKEHLEIDVKTKKVSKIGETICQIELENEKDKMIIMQNKSKLRSVEGGAIYINDDLTKKEREKQRQIRKIAQQERERGKTVKIGYSKITIDGEIWKWNRDKEELEKTEPKN